MKIQPQLTFDSVVFDKDTDAHLVINLVAPAIEWQAKRPRICVIPCIDISGSMAGAKLDAAKKAALKLVDQLAPGDYAGLVTFSDSGRVDYTPQEMTPARKEELKAVIGKIHIEGGTNFSDGMIKALEAAKRLDLGGATISRVIMLTDGQPTHGIATKSEELNKLLAAQMGHVSLSAFGFGSDPDQALLSSLAGIGQGNYAFIQDPDNALPAFGKELGGLLSTYAQSIEVEVAPSNGHTVTDVISDVKTEEETTGEVSMSVPAILAEETMSLVLAVKLSAQKQPGPRQVNAFNIKTRFQRLAEDGSLVTETVETKAKVQFVKAGDEQKRPTKEVDEIVARAQLVKAQIEADEAAQRGDFQAAGQLFDLAAQSFQDRGFGGLVGATNHIGQNYSAAMYNASQGRRTALRAATSRGSGTSSMDAEDEAVLLSANYSMSNSAQEVMTQNFIAPDPAAPAPVYPGANPVPPAAAPVVDLGGLVQFDNGVSLNPHGGLNVSMGYVPPAPTTGGLAVPSILGGGSSNAIWVGPAPVQVAGPVTVTPAPEPAKPVKKKLSKAKSKRW